MTATEQQAIYDKIHEVQVELIKDNQTSHDTINESIVKLTLKVKETNGLKAKMEDLANAQLEHLTTHNIIDKQKSNGFNKTTTIISVGIAVIALVFALIQSLI